VPWAKDLSVLENPTRLDLMANLTAQVASETNNAQLLALLADVQANPTLDNNAALSMAMCLEIYPNNPQFVASFERDLALEDPHIESTCALLSTSTSELAIDLLECLCGPNVLNRPKLYCMCGLYVADVVDGIAAARASNSSRLMAASKVDAIQAVRRSPDRPIRHARLPGYEDYDEKYDDHHRMTITAEQFGATIKALNLLQALLASPILEQVCSAFGDDGDGGTGGTKARAGRIAKLLDSKIVQEKIKPLTKYAANVAKRAILDEDLCCAPEFCKDIPGIPFLSVCIEGGICVPKLALYFSTGTGNESFLIDSAGKPTFTACYDLEGASCYTEDAGCDDPSAVSTLMADRLTGLEIFFNVKLCIAAERWPKWLDRIGIGPPCVGQGFCKSLMSHSSIATEHHVM
jgi:hypothetical protein